MLVELRDEDFDPWLEIQRYEKNQPHLVGKYGATSVFVGTMRDFNEGDDVSSMTFTASAGQIFLHVPQRIHFSESISCF